MAFRASSLNFASEPAALNDVEPPTHPGPAAVDHMARFVPLLAKFGAYGCFRLQGAAEAMKALAGSEARCCTCLVCTGKAASHGKVTCTLPPTNMAPVGGVPGRSNSSWRGPLSGTMLVGGRAYPGSTDAI